MRPKTDLRIFDSMCIFTVYVFPTYMTCATCEQKISVRPLAPGWCKFSNMYQRFTDSLISEKDWVMWP